MISSYKENLAAFLAWFRAAADQGFVSDFGGVTMILPEWLGSVGYDFSGRSIHVFRFDRPESWVAGADGCCVLPYGVVFSLGFAGRLCLFVPFPPNGGAPGDVVLVDGRRIPTKKLEIPDVLSGLGMVACLFVLK